MRLELVEVIARNWPTGAWRDVHVLIAVSGGPDSMALLRAMSELKQRTGGIGQLFVGHVNHQLRGDDSHHDQAWVERECKRLGVPVVVKAAEVAAAASAAGDGIEAAARGERYRLLTTAAEQIGARYVAVGHHRDDQVETVLFRLFRGTGLRGLGGMPRNRALTPGVTLVRPLLDCTRPEMLAYLRRLGQDYRTDETNVDMTFARNRLRQNLLPQLREHFDADVDAAVFHAAEQLADAAEAIGQLVQQLVSQCDVQAHGPQETSLLIGPLAKQSPYLVAEVVRAVWREARLPEQAMTRARWVDLAELAIRGDGAGQNLPGDIYVAIRSGRLVFGRS